MKYCYIGLDVSSDKVDLCWLNEPTKVSIRDFYESPEFKKHHAELNKSEYSIKYIQSLNPSIIILEPTGTYSRFWTDEFNRLGLKYLLVNQTLVKQTRLALGGSSNKDDPFDSLVMLELYFKYYVERYDRRFWIKDRSETIIQISRLLQEIDSVVKRRTQSINMAKQRLSFEFPAKQSVKSRRENGSLDPDILPSWWAWCCGWTETGTWKLRNNEKTKYQNEYAEAMSRNEGSGLSTLTRECARSICHWHICEAMLERELIPLLNEPEFADYHEVFEEFGFGQRERAWLLTRIYPFEGFFGVPKFRSRRRFRQALGFGKITSQSGKSSSTSRKNSGAASVHAIVFCWVGYRISKGMNDRLLAPGVPKLNKWDCCPQTKVCQEIREFFIKRAYHEVSLQKKTGFALTGAKSATGRKAVELLFERFYAKWVDEF